VEYYAIEVNHQNNPAGSWILESSESDDRLWINVKYGDNFYSVSPELALRVLIRHIIHVSFVLYSRFRECTLFSMHTYIVLTQTLTHNAHTHGCTQGNAPAVGDLERLNHLVFTVPNVQPTSMSQMYRDVGMELCPNATIHFLREPQAAFLNEYYFVSVSSCCCVTV